MTNEQIVEYRAFLGTIKRLGKTASDALDAVEAANWAGRRDTYYEHCATPLIESVVAAMKQTVVGLDSLVGAHHAEFLHSVGLRPDGSAPAETPQEANK